LSGYKGIEFDIDSLIPDYIQFDFNVGFNFVVGESIFIDNVKWIGIRLKIFEKNLSFLSSKNIIDYDPFHKDTIEQHIVKKKTEN